MGGEVIRVGGARGRGLVLVVVRLLLTRCEIDVSIIGDEILWTWN